MNQLSVRVKILLLAAIMLVITCLVAAVGFYSNRQAKQSIDDMYHHNLMITQYLSNANNQLRSLNEDIAYVLIQDYAPADRKLLLDEMSSRVSSIQENVARIKEIDHSQRAQETIALLEKDLSNFAEQIKACEDLQNTQEDRIRMLNHLSMANSMGARLSRLTPDNVLQGKLLFQETEVTYERTIKIFLGIILFGLLLGIAATTVISGNIATLLQESLHQLNAVADGDLTQEIPQELAERHDELGIMVQALQRTQESLRQILSEVRHESEQNVAMAEDVHELVQSLDHSTQDMSYVMEMMVANMEKTAAATSDVQQLSGQIGLEIKNRAEDLASFVENNMSKYCDPISETAAQSQNEADYLWDFVQKSNDLSQKLAGSMETMNKAMGDIAKATLEGAVGSTTIAEKVEDVAAMANEILNKVDMSRQGAENLRKQVEKFQV